ncbi:MAG TPA: hypothetical protein VHV30_02230 [Polyangiaceae bacterium]|jgi:hypothetical protein|nr:hypothetical protein [Polyangiaceae bacterium]
MAAPHPLTDDDARAFARALDKYEPKDVHLALDRVDDELLKSCQASINASGPLVGGASETGVFLNRLASGRAVLRVAYADIHGAIYDELELAGASVKLLVDTLLADLQARQAPHRA